MSFFTPSTRTDLIQPLRYSRRSDCISVLISVKIRQHRNQSICMDPNPVITFEANHLCHGQTSFSSATIYCPSTGGPLPSVVLVGGWLCGEHALAAWAPFFAAHGIVAMTIGTPSPHSHKPADRSLALLDASKALQSENAREDSTHLAGQ